MGILSNVSSSEMSRLMIWKIWGVSIKQEVKYKLLKLCQFFILAQICVWLFKFKQRDSRAVWTRLFYFCYASPGSLEFKLKQNGHWPSVVAFSRQLCFLFGRKGNIKQNSSERKLHNIIFCLSICRQKSFQHEQVRYKIFSPRTSLIQAT